MANYIVYWKTYWQDMVDNPWPGCDWHTRSKAFYDAVRKGDSIWVVVSGESSASDEWRLLSYIAVAGSEKSKEPTRWGRYRFAGNKKLCKIYDIKLQPDFTAILWALKFQSGKRIRTLGRKIGQALQSRGFRSLAESDAILLNDYAKTLKVRRNTK